MLLMQGERSLNESERTSYKTPIDSALNISLKYFLQT